MKKILTIVVMLAALTAAAQTAPKDTVAVDSAMNAARIKTLETCRDSLQQVLSIEDAKRNVSRPGVRPETLERINNRQDSICLALRSQITDVNLEINELTPASVVSLHVVQQYNSIIGGKENNTEAKPTKPTQQAITPKRKKK